MFLYITIIELLDLLWSHPWQNIRQKIEDTNFFFCFSEVVLLLSYTNETLENYFLLNFDFYSASVFSYVSSVYRISF